MISQLSSSVPVRFPVAAPARILVRKTSLEQDGASLLTSTPSFGLSWTTLSQLPLAMPSSMPDRRQISRGARRARDGSTRRSQFRISCAHDHPLGHRGRRLLLSKSASSMPRITSCARLCVSVANSHTSTYGDHTLGPMSNIYSIEQFNSYPTENSKHSKSSF